MSETQSETEAKPWTAEDLEAIRSHEASGYSMIRDSRWLATLKQRDQTLAMAEAELREVKAREAATCQRMRDLEAELLRYRSQDQAKELAAVRAREAAEMAEARRLCDANMLRIQELEEALGTAQCQLAAADRVASSVVPMTARIRELESRLERALSQAPVREPIVLPNAKAIGGARIALYNLCNDPTSEATRQAGETVRKAMVGEAALREEIETLKEQALSADRIAQQATGAREALAKELDVWRARLMSAEALAGIRPPARPMGQWPWCPVHGHFGSQVTARGTCPQCPSQG